MYSYRRSTLTSTFYRPRRVAMKKILFKIIPAMSLMFFSGCYGYIIPPGAYPPAGYSTTGFQETFVINNSPPPGGCRPWYGQIICDPGPGTRDYENHHRNKNKSGNSKHNRRRHCNECHAIDFPEIQRVCGQCHNNMKGFLI